MEKRLWDLLEELAGELAKDADDRRAKALSEAVAKAVAAIKS